MTELVFVTVDAQQHTGDGTNTCITDTIDRYLIDLIIPPNNLTCP